MWTEEKIGRTEARNLIGRDKDKEIFCPSLSLAKQTQLGKINLIYCQLKFLCFFFNYQFGYWKAKRQTLECIGKPPFLLTSPGSTSVQTPLSPPCIARGCLSPFSPQWGPVQKQQAYSQCAVVSLCCSFLLTLLLYSSVGPPWAAGQIPALVPGAPPPFSDHGVPSAASHSLCSLCLSGIFFPFLNMFS